MNVLELYSGIGGMHLALSESGINGTIKASIDINPTANLIYKHNFPETNLLNRNIEGLSSKFINNLGIDTILMSPPCQPFTRNGIQKDINDSRTDSFLHLLDILPELSVDKILIENVKGFEISQMRDKLINTLENCDFYWQEFILSPSQFGVPNTRYRYYCLARRQTPFDITMPISQTLTEECFQINEILENVCLDEFSLSDKILRKYVKLLDICHPESRKSCCFTKAYSRYIEGTGSVFTHCSQDKIQECFKKITNISLENDEYLHICQSLKLRFFTPREICRLMCFPETFHFPEQLTNRQKYMVLGNSINIKVVSELIKIL